VLFHLFLAAGDGDRRFDGFARRHWRGRVTEREEFQLRVECAAEQENECGQIKPQEQRHRAGERAVGCAEGGKLPERERERA
jgi:hypothetical protein